ncbi:MAG: cysteine desulfurase family protein [Chthoniobacterales bacterium]
MVYLDYNATSPLVPEALEAMQYCLQTTQGNPSSIHSQGREARAILDDAREQMAALLKVKAHEIIFTSGGTEANNLAIFGLARSQAERGKHLITSAVEHHAVLHAFEYLKEHEGFELTILPVNSEGVVVPELLSETLRKDTTLVSIMSANNETGVRQNIKKLAGLAHAAGALFHSDAVQSFGKEKVLPADLEIDALSIAAHKFGGPKGIGMLWLHSGLPLGKFLVGGAQENQRRAGTENVAAIAGQSAAAHAILAEGTGILETIQTRQTALREKLWAGIQEIYPPAVRNGAPELCLANTLNISFPNTDGEALLIGLDLEGICVSSGSACMVGSMQASHVLLAMGVEPELAASTVRFSLGKQTHEKEITDTIAALRRVLERFQATS